MAPLPSIAAVVLRFLKPSIPDQQRSGDSLMSVTESMAGIARATVASQGNGL